MHSLTHFEIYVTELSRLAGRGGFSSEVTPARTRLTNCPTRSCPGSPGCVTGFECDNPTGILTLGVKGPDAEHFICRTRKRRHVATSWESAL